MTPLQAAKTHCANYQGDGSCLGVQLNDKLQPVQLIKHPKCVLALTGVRCGYFEESVIPMNRADWPGLRTPQEHEDFADAVRHYQKSANVSSTKRRVCPECKERELEHSKRLCYVCRNKRRRATFRLANKNATSTTEVGNSSIDNQSLTNGQNSDPSPDTKES